MEDRRKHARTGLEEPGYISSGGACWSCTVVNFSAEGVAIDVADPSVVPDRFVLMIARDRHVYLCRFAWAQLDRIGASIEPGAAAPMPDWAPELQHRPRRGLADNPILSQL